jgi:predicted phosphate transport protein (TIGR00153 family)
MGLQAIVRWFLPREDHFYGFLEAQAEVAHEASLAVARFKDESVSAEAVRQSVQELEHKGDRIAHEVEESIARTFVTPIDREDLQKLSQELDDVLDLMNGAARACVLYGVERPTQPMVGLIDKLVECTAVLKNALPHLRRHEYSDLIEASRLVRKLEKDGDTVFRTAVSTLFKNADIDAKQLLREREVLEHLENSIDHCQRVASTLATLAIKHG